ncbi:MAG TPA: cytochrome c [Oligoflexia bacterium]|nr:cytochrome c [Oligoflexia bacterium]HMP48071.1 cytochrome c [Oligoflexia bacterium]
MILNSTINYSVMRPFSLFTFCMLMLFFLTACERESRPIAGENSMSYADISQSEDVKLASVHSISRNAGISDVLPGAEKTVVLDGATLFQTNCAACHQASGAGIPGAFPPLVGSPYVTGDVDRLAAIMIYGLNGPINVLGNTYSGVMVGLGATLSNEELSSIASYIRSSWGNSAPKVGPEVFKASREKHGTRSMFTIQELGEES